MISVENVDHIYMLPAKLHREGVDDRVCEKLGIWAARANLDQWDTLVDKIMNPVHSVRIAIVGKYTHLVDTYMSLNEALRHGGVANDHRSSWSTSTPRRWIWSMWKIGWQTSTASWFRWFRYSGTEGKSLRSVRRKAQHPFFGICLNVQLAVVVQNVLGHKGAMLWGSTQILPIPWSSDERAARGPGSAEPCAWGRSRDRREPGGAHLWLIRDLRATPTPV